ncbi:MAG TPA: HAMP domain-containing sensor histidine kinase [Gemmatimonadaceae bacterium]|nr:HAMP domain-containing sensor histidine kinase [Gemmatimonadaceae bacterium]
MMPALTLRRRLAIGTVGIAIVLALPLVVAVRSLERVHKTTLELRNGAFAASLLIGSLRQGTDDLRRAEDALVYVGTPETHDRMMRQISTMRTLADSLDNFSLRSASVNVRLALDSLSVLANEEYERSSAAKHDAAEVISTQWVRPRFAIIEQTIGSSEQVLRERSRDSVNAATDDTAAAERVAITAMIIAILLAGLISLWLIRSITRPVFDLETGMHAVASGDFTRKLSVRPNRQDEFGRLSESYEAMANRLAQLDRLKAEFVSVASHELKTPINVILGYVELLEDGIYGKLQDQQREVCETIAAQARNLTRLVRRLLDVSRFEAGGGALECRQLNLGRFLDTLQSSFSVLAMQRSVHFQVDRSESLPTEVRWDEDRMSEVVGNLLSNAFKFTPRGGRVELSAEAHDDDVVIEVRDTGAGIPPEQLPRIFQKFYQADNQAKASAKGTGLGLAIAKEIVEAHGGSISATSIAGQGATFRITMPVASDVRRSGQFPIQTIAS